MSRQISITVPTDDQGVLREVGRMFERLAEATRGRTACCCGDTLSPATTAAQEVSLADVLAAAAPSADEPRIDVAAAVAADVDDGEGEQSELPVAPAVSAGISGVPAPPTDMNFIMASGDANLIPASTERLAAVELDAQGLPWDARINTENRAQTQKNVWKMKKNLPAGLYDTVIAELRTAMGAPTPAAAPVAPAAAPVAPAAAPVAPAAAPVAPAAAPTTFPEFLQTVTRLKIAGKISDDEVKSCCLMHGIPSLPLVATRPDLMPTIFAEIKAICDTRP